MLYANNYIYLSNFFGNSLVVYDPSNDTIINTVAETKSTTPVHQYAYAGKQHMCYIGGTSGKSLYLGYMPTMTVNTVPGSTSTYSVSKFNVATTPIPAPTENAGYNTFCGICAIGSTVYTVSTLQIRRITDTTTNTVVYTVETPQTGTRSISNVTCSSRYIYIATYLDNGGTTGGYDIRIYNPAATTTTTVIVDTISISFQVKFLCYFSLNSKDYIFYANSTNTISILDVGSKTTIDTVTIDNCIIKEIYFSNNKFYVGHRDAINIFTYYLTYCSLNTTTMKFGTLNKVQLINTPTSGTSSMGCQMCIVNNKLYTGNYTGDLYIYNIES